MKDLQSTSNDWRETLADELRRSGFMTQNTSHAVMSQRVEAHDSLDDFPTPPWATRALLTHVLTGIALTSQNCWEPACNRGHMARPLAEHFRHVFASDIHDYGRGYACRDFLWPVNADNFDWVITNPPFRLAEQFAEQARGVARVGYAVLVRTQFLESVGRYHRLFSKHPPFTIAQFSERVPMFKGRLDAEGSTATSYCWLVWLQSRDITQFTWIPPCRKRLERPGDYDA